MIGLQSFGQLATENGRRSTLACLLLTVVGLCAHALAGQRDASLVDRRTPVVRVFEAPFANIPHLALPPHRRTLGYEYNAAHRTPQGAVA